MFTDDNLVKSFPWNSLANIFNSKMYTVFPIIYVMPEDNFFVPIVDNYFLSHF